MIETAFDILYDGFREYQLKIKGYVTCASKTEIEQWEMWKEHVVNTIKEQRKKCQAGKSRR